MESTLIWGALALVSGIFICAYGNVLFRFVLAVLGFMIGFSVVMWLGGGLGQPLQIIVAIVLGGILAAVGYALFKLALYFAGAILGITIVFAILGLVGVAGSDLGAFGWILALAGAVLGGIFGRRLGDLAIVFATALAGAYLVVLGLARIFVTSIDSGNALKMLGAGFPLLLFLTIALISGLTQYEVLRIRRRFLR
jgi:Domain of unknown function (DUF4203)